MNDPLVSVIVPIYKVENYLDECIGSIVNQTYTNLEILLLDDGSPDNCGVICDQWAAKDNRICVIHKQNGGLSDTRNTGIALARGTYVYMPDGDDYLLPDAMKTMVSYAVAYQAQCVLGGYLRLYPNGTMESHSGTEVPVVCKNGADIERCILRRLVGAEYSSIPHLSQSVWTKLYLRQFILDNDLRFLPTMEIGMEDFHFNLCFFQKAESVVIIPESNYVYRYNPRSITTTFQPERANRLIRLYNRMKEETILSDPQEYRQMLAANILGNISVHIKQIVASNLPDKIAEISKEMEKPAIREMLSLCRVLRIKFPLSLFCLLMKYRMKRLLYLLIKVFLLMNR